MKIYKINEESGKRIESFDKISLETVPFNDGEKITDVTLSDGSSIFDDPDKETISTITLIR